MEWSNEDIKAFVDDDRNISAPKHLQYLIVSARDYLYREDKIFFENKKNQIIEKIRSNNGVHLTSEEKCILYCKKNIVHFQIYLVKSEKCPPDNGYTMLFEKGADIIYPANCDDHDLKHIIIAHEIGHLVMHTNERDENFNRRFPKFTDRHEDEANYFAERVLLKGYQEYSSGNFNRKYITDELELRKKIENAQKKELCTI